MHAFQLIGVGKKYFGEGGIEKLSDWKIPLERYRRKKKRSSVTTVQIYSVTVPENA